MMPVRSGNVGGGVGGIPTFTGIFASHGSHDVRAQHRDVVVIRRGAAVEQKRPERFRECARTARVISHNHIHEKVGGCRIQLGKRRAHGVNERVAGAQREGCVGRHGR